MARFGFGLLLLIAAHSTAGPVYISDNQRFELSDNWERVKVIDADDSSTNYTLAFYIPDISGRDRFKAYVYSADNGMDKAVTIRKYYSGTIDFMEFIGDNRISDGDLYLEQE